MRCTWLIVVAVAISLSSQAAPRVGLLVRSEESVLSPEQTSALARELAKQLREPVLEPRQVLRRLRATPQVVAAERSARGALERALQAALRMARGEAIAEATRAIAHLQAVKAEYVLPELLARAFTELALAELLRPADPAAAVRAFRRATAAHPGFRPDVDRLPPRAAQLLAEAQKRQRPLPLLPLEEQELRKLARSCGLAELAWVEVRRASAAQLSFRVMSISQQTELARRERNETVEYEALSERLTSALVFALRGPAVPQAFAVQPAAPVAPRVTPRARPWYKRWWVWTAAGAVLAGAGVGITLALMGAGEHHAATPSPGQDFEFRFHF